VKTLTLLGGGGGLTGVVASLEALLLGPFREHGCCCRVVWMVAVLLGNNDLLHQRPSLRLRLSEGEPMAGSKASQGELVASVWALF
jgi:hypothetical protein